MPYHIMYAVVGQAIMTAKGWYPSLSPEEKKAYNNKRRSKYSSVPEEKKLERSEKRKAQEQKYFENLSPEEQKEYRIKRQQRWRKFQIKFESSLTDQQKASRYDKVLENNMNRYNSLTEEQKAERLKKFSEYARARRQQLRELVISHYSHGSMRCCRCGFSDIRALCVDHINGGGRKHAKELGGHVYEWIIKNNFPNDMFQVLCQNCNIIKKIENKEDYAPRQKKIKQSQKDKQSNNVEKIGVGQ